MPKAAKYIKEALDRRAKAAIRVSYYDGIVLDFILKNQIEVATDDYAGGVEMYVHPYESAERVLHVILTGGFSLKIINCVFGKPL